MIQINHAILHILDLSTGMTVASQQEIEADNGPAIAFLSRHIEKALAGAGSKTGPLDREGEFGRKARDYLAGGDFVEFSTWVGERAYGILCRSEKLEATDLALCDFEQEGVRGLALFLFANKTAFTHYVNQDEKGTRNDIIRHQALLPAPGQKVERFAILNPATWDVHYGDKPMVIDGQETQVIPGPLVGCGTAPSSQDTLKIVEKAAKQVAEAHGQNPAVAVSKAKAHVGESASTRGELAPERIAREVFADSEPMQRAFSQQAAEAGLARPVKVNVNYAVRRSRTHKIKTDTGIELSIPVEYFENPDYVEFINNADGSIAIELKNIGEIIN